MIHFMSPYLLALIPIVLGMLFVATRRRKSYGHTQVDSQKNLRTLSLISKVPVLCLAGFLTLLCLALARPTLPEARSTKVIESRDFMIAVDVSGSMDTDIADPNQKAMAGGNTPQTDADGKPIKTTRLTVARKAIEQFVPTRQGDRIGLIYFDDEAYFSWPLTTDLNLISERNLLTGKYTGGGTNFDGPDEAGYSKMGPLQASINHYKELGQAKTKVIIMVTDGEASIKPERLQQLLDQLKADNIKVYVLGVAEGWVNNSSSTQDLRKLSELSGGKVLVVGDASAMQAGFDEINKLEKSSVEVETTPFFRDIYEYFVIAALLLALIFAVTAAFVREDV